MIKQLMVLLLIAAIPAYAGHYHPNTYDAISKRVDRAKAIRHEITEHRVVNYYGEDHNDNWRSDRTVYKDSASYSHSGYRDRDNHYRDYGGEYREVDINVGIAHTDSAEGYRGRWDDVEVRTAQFNVNTVQNGYHLGHARQEVEIQDKESGFRAWIKWLFE
jgi:hypothetical protein